MISINAAMTAAQGGNFGDIVKGVIIAVATAAISFGIAAAIGQMVVAGTGSAIAGSVAGAVAGFAASYGVNGLVSGDWHFTVMDAVNLGIAIWSACQLDPRPGAEATLGEEHYGEIQKNEGGAGLLSPSDLRGIPSDFGSIFSRDEESVHSQMRRYLQFHERCSQAEMTGDLDLMFDDGPTIGCQGATWGDDYNLFREWFIGHAPEKYVYGPNSPRTQAMMDHAGVREARFEYNRTPGTFRASEPFSHGYDFGLKGIWESGFNPTAQYIGGYTVRIYPNCDNVTQTVSIINRTSRRSFLYHLTPESWNAPAGEIMGNQ